jgi:hypothetical protein
MRTHSLGAVDISVLGITFALSVLLAVPTFVSDLVVGVRLKVGNTPLTIHSSKGKVVDVLAGAMPRTIIGTRGSGASLAFVTVETLTQTGSSVTNALAGTLCIVVEGTEVIRGIHPSNLKRAHTVGAIATLAQGGTKTNTPVVKALTHIIYQA